MKRVKKGDIVTRSSYNNDILFYVEKVLKGDNRGKLAILRGVDIRVIADAPLDDLVVKENINIEYNDIEVNKRFYFDKLFDYDSERLVKSGKILHLDGDRYYSFKTEKYYRSKGLNSIVRYIAENKQPSIVNSLLNRYKPDILVITGHDGMIKNGSNYNDINNYRNSQYFVNSVLQARKWNSNKNELVIFAGACQSFYEMLIGAGANFASSPSRILIDFKDPLIVAEEVSITSRNKIVLMSDIEPKIRNGRNAINGIGALGRAL